MANEKTVNTPKAFISYSWSSPDHELWVENFAKKLVENGVDIVLDQWDLEMGQDANHFMEQMVNEPSITKVIMVIDREYVRKANERSGGAGTEAQIISAEVYQNVKQTKFGAVVVECDEKGKILVPNYYKSRLYVDLSRVESYEENFEKLLDWLYEKKGSKKPELGKRKKVIQHGFYNGSLQKLHEKIINSLHSGNSAYIGLLAEYFDEFINSLKTLRIQYLPDSLDLTKTMLSHLDSLKDVKEKLIEILYLIIRHQNYKTVYLEVEEFLEKLIALKLEHKRSSYNDILGDHYRFFLYEMFLILSALLVKQKEYKAFNELFRRKYIIQMDINLMIYEEYDYTIFYATLASRNFINEINNTDLFSVEAYLIKNRSENSKVSFLELMQADLIIFIIDLILSARENKNYYWYPAMLNYFPTQYGGFNFPVFSKINNDLELFELLGNNIIKNRVELIKMIQQNCNEIRVRYDKLSVLKLIGFDEND